MEIGDPNLPQRLRDAGYMMRMVFNDDDTVTLHGLNINTGERYELTGPGLGKVVVEEFARQVGIQ